MPDTTYTSGSWVPYPGQEDAFVQAWADFARWASGESGAGVLTLTRDAFNPERFVSIGDWETSAAAREWKSSPEFTERIARVLQHVSEFTSSELTPIVTASEARVQVVARA
jgi:heme-degrading monooxygenase HmoA